MNEIQETFVKEEAKHMTLRAAVAKRSRAGPFVSISLPPQLILTVYAQFTSIAYKCVRACSPHRYRAFTEYFSSLALDYV